MNRLHKIGPSIERAECEVADARENLAAAEKDLADLQAERDSIQEACRLLPAESIQA